jgi:hypothetical protein
VGDGEKLLTYLNSALKVLSGLDIFTRGTKKKVNFVDQCRLLHSGMDSINEFMTPCSLVGWKEWNSVDYLPSPRRLR